MSTRSAGRRPGRGPVLGLSDGMAAAAGLRRLRDAAGLTRAELGALVNWTPDMTARRETVAVRMTAAEAQAAAVALGTDLTGLLAAGRASTEAAA